MTYSILLDVYQKLVPADHFAVSFSGTLVQCQAQTHHGSDYKSWLKSDFIIRDIEPKSLTNDKGGIDSGKIVKLVEKLAAAAAGARKGERRKNIRRSRP